MKTINTFLKDKLKEKKIRVDTFITECDVSKSTIYRVMKGYQKPSDELLEKMSSILKLSDLEERELRYYSSLLNADEDVLSARNEVLNLLYKPSPIDTDKIELVYYDGEKYIRTFDKVLDELLSITDMGNFSCKFRLVNCCKESIIQPLFETFSKLMKASNNYSIEHLVNFSTYNPKDNITILNEIIPLLPLDNYTVMYCETEGSSGNSVFYDFLILDYQYQDDNGNAIQKHLYISFLHDKLSACYVVEDENLQDFFERSYTSIQRDYKLALNNQKKFEFIGSLCVEFESKHDICLFKPNPCYNRIPLSVYESLIDRSSEEVMHYFLKSFMCDNVTKETIKSRLKELISYMGTRIKASHQNKQTDILTRRGLESFASTGRLSDHLDGLPPFTSTEVKAVLEYIKSRDIDASDGYNFYILNDDYSNEDLLITCFKDFGLLIEYNNPKYKANDMPYCVIEHKGLSDIFLDFAENYVPTMLALPQEEAHRFIDELIQKYC